VRSRRTSGIPCVAGGTRYAHLSANLETIARSFARAAGGRRGLPFRAVRRIAKECLRERERLMEMERVTCPWCHREVRVESRRKRRYSCSFCKEEFSFTPNDALLDGRRQTQPTGVGSVPASEFVETPFVKDLVGRTFVYLQDGLMAYTPPRPNANRLARKPWPKKREGPTRKSARSQRRVGTYTNHECSRTHQLVRLLRSAHGHVLEGKRKQPLAFLRWSP
jgi:hypothetical protein